MKNELSLFSTAVFLALVMSGPAIAQSDAKKAAVVVPALAETHLKKNVFAGGESRISAMHSVKSDCSSGQLPDVRIVAKPSKGELRLEPSQTAVDRDKNNRYAHCNGKLVEAVAIYYKPNEGSGRDRVVLDVDFKNGTVNRYIYTIDVR